MKPPVNSHILYSHIFTICLSVHLSTVKCTLIWSYLFLAKHVFSSSSCLCQWCILLFLVFNRQRRSVNPLHVSIWIWCGTMCFINCTVCESVNSPGSDINLTVTIWPTSVTIEIEAYTLPALALLSVQLWVCLSTPIGLSNMYLSKFQFDV